MQIDWFTFVAQVANFLILVWLLKRFLYGPVIAMMDRREADLAARFADAEQQKRDAEREAATYTEMKETLAHQRQEQIDKAKADADTYRRDLIKTAREEVEHTRKGWQESVEREQRLFLESLQQRAGSHVLDIARRVLHDLAGADIEAQIVAVFARGLHALDDKDADALREALAGGAGAVVRSAFPIPAEQRRILTRALHDRLLEAPTIAFEITPELEAGIELTVEGWSLAWGIDSYLGALEEQFVEEASIDEEAPA